MNPKLSFFFEKLIRFLYKKTDFYTLDLLNGFYIEPIQLYRPTTYYCTLLKLEDVFDPRNALFHDKNLNRILNNLIITSESYVNDFDFSKLQSLVASKSFSNLEKHITGSWFKDLYSWGRGMYPADNLKAQTKEDWLKNIRHIENEGFPLHRPIRVTYYSWMDIYLGSNCGGSHHAAMVVYQSIRDKIEYKREANITTHSINITAVNELDNEYYSFIASNNQTEQEEPEYCYKRLKCILQKHVSDNTFTLPVYHYYKDITLFFIPKINLKIDKSIFEDYLNKSQKQNKLIKLCDYLRTPNRYHKAPFVHQLNYIFLDSPVRDFNLQQPR